MILGQLAQKATGGLWAPKVILDPWALLAQKGIVEKKGIVGLSENRDL